MRRIYIYMEFLYSRLRRIDVISLNDGKNLGRVYDLAFTFPENRVKGFYVTGCKGFRLTRSDMFIPIADVSKIGEDVVLVRCEPKRECPPEKRRDRCPHGEGERDCFQPDRRRDLGEYE